MRRWRRRPRNLRAPWRASSRAPTSWPPMLMRAWLRTRWRTPRPWLPGPRLRRLLLPVTRLPGAHPRLLRLLLPVARLLPGPRPRLLLLPVARLPGPRPRLLLLRRSSLMWPWVGRWRLPASSWQLRSDPEHHRHTASTRGGEAAGGLSISSRPRMVKTNNYTQERREEKKKETRDEDERATNG